jgi:tRNA pseudouridine55 synthase
MSFDGWTATVALTCSAGFYVRSFAHSLGEAVGTGAFLAALQRTRSGEFRLDEAMSLDALFGDANAPAAREGSREAVLDWLIPMDRLLPGYPAVTLTEEGRVWVGHGRELGAAQFLPEGRTREPDRHGSTMTNGHEWIRLFDADGHLVALATPGSTPGTLHPSVVLN